MAIVGAGTKLQLKVDAAYVDIGSIRSISGPAKTITDVDTTCLDTADGHKTFLGGWADGGTVTMEMLYTPTGYGVMDGHYSPNSGLLNEWKILLLSGDAITFFGYVKDMGMEVPLDDVITAPVTLKISGKPVYTPD